jgi:DNA repair protein RadC
VRKRREASYLECGEPGGGPALAAGHPSSLTDLELLAIVLDDSTCGSESLALADRLLDGGSAALLKRLHPRRLRSLAGDLKTRRLLASLELGRRALRGEGRRVLSSPRHVHRYARTFAEAEREHFLAIHLSTRHVPNLLEVVSVGTLNASLVHPREVFRRAIREGTASLILAHNHPSGDPSPSADDIEITSRLGKVGELVGIEVLDHVILAGERYFSFREEGLVTGR